MGVGPISYREVMIYADELELGPSTKEFLWEVIRRVDQAFLKFLNQKLDARRNAAAKKPKELSRSG